MSTQGQMTSITPEDTIVLNIDKFLMPISLFFSSIVLAGGLFFGLNNIATAIKGGGLSTGTTANTTTDTGTGNVAGATTTVTLDKVQALFDGSNMSFGDANRKILFVEFSDPSCPYCHIASGLNGELNTEAGARFTLVQDGGTYVAPVAEMKKLVDSGEASFVWLYTNGHGNGELSTQAMYCAYEQNKFWEAHDLLMSAEGYDAVNNEIQNDTANIPVVVEFLKNVVDSSALKSCLESGKYADRIESDSQIATSFGVSGTPGFYVDTTNFAGAYSWTDMASAVETARNN